MVMQNKALICALEVLINSQYATNMHANKQLVYSDSKVLPFYFILLIVQSYFITIAGIYLFSSNCFCVYVHVDALATIMPINYEKIEKAETRTVWNGWVKEGHRGRIRG